MTYFFILGSNPALSLSELAAKLDLAGDETLIGDEALLWPARTPIQPEELIRNLGGTVKIGEVWRRGTKQSDLLPAIKTMLQPGSGKFHFGFSIYGQERFDFKRLALPLKNHLKEMGVSCRWVESREKNLSSVVVAQNKLLSGGAEIVLLRQGERYHLGRTLVVQAFKELSRRDYGRPARDDRSGMLPPKLAQIMINLARAAKDGLILDPFCGSGTILAEAALMGYANLGGTDISEKAINDTKKNLEWLTTSYKLQVTSYKLQIADATKIATTLKPDSIDAIVTEPYLGPQRGKIDTRKVVKELEELYAASLEEFQKILKPGGRVVMVWPVFKTAAGLIMLKKNISGRFRPLDPLERFPSSPAIKLTNRRTILYGRPGQNVWREIVVLEK